MNIEIPSESLINTDKPTVLFGKSEVIERAIIEGKIKDIINASRDNPDGMEILACYLNNSNAGNNNGSDNGNGGSKPKIITDPFARYFNTQIGDSFIGGEHDEDAVRRYLFYPDCGAYFDNTSYINVIIDNSVNALWLGAVTEAINAWNYAINNNPRNYQILFETPELKFRIALQENQSDYGNIVVSMIDNDELVNDGAYAEAPLGSYRLISNGIYKHQIGNFLHINNNHTSFNYQRAITIIVHEIGHTVGFRHSNTQAPNIVGTTSTAESVMTQGSVTWNTTGFHSEDLIAIDLIFNVDPMFEFILCD
ncbi:MAG: hypothetical protein R2783_06050 [Gelidibacter sp.]